MNITSNEISTNKTSNKTLPKTPPKTAPAKANFHLLSQLTYWYDRRVATGIQEKYASKPLERLPDSKMGRWTKKIGREDVVYHSVAVSHEEGPAPASSQLKKDGTMSQNAKESHGHLGQKPIF